MATPTNGNGNLIDEFEDSLQQCMTILTKEEGLTNNSIGSSLAVDKEEAKAEVEQVVSRFIDLARQTEAFFLQKRFLLSALKPELLVKEDISELRQELARKDELIKRHYDKIATWQHLLADLQGWDKSLAQGSASNGLANGQGSQGPPGNGAPNPVLQQQQQQMLHQQQLQQQQQQQQQQQLHMQHQQMQQQQLHQQQVQSGGAVPPGLQGVNVNQQGMFLGQGVPGRAGFPVGGVPGVGVGNSALQGPLAFLEKTTSNIGMPERRS